MLPPVQHLLILLWPDGTPVAVSKRDGEPRRTTRARFAHHFPNEEKRRNYYFKYKDLGLRSATVRIEVIEGPNVPQTSASTPL